MSLFRHLHTPFTPFLPVPNKPYGFQCGRSLTYLLFRLCIFSFQPWSRVGRWSWNFKWVQERSRAGRWDWALIAGSVDCLAAELFLNSPHRRVVIVVMAVADGLFALCGSEHASDELFMSSPPPPSSPQVTNRPYPSSMFPFWVTLDQPVGPRR